MIKKNDILLTSAINYARAVLETVTEIDNIGKHLDVVCEAKRSATHYFECLLPGYPGWRWAVVLSRHAKSTKILVTETELVAA